MKSTRKRLRDDPSRLTCSTCGRMFLLDETETPPFCSERCKNIDLGRWLDESYSVPDAAKESDDDDDGESYSVHY